MSNTFTQLGSFTIVDQADLINLQSAANIKGDTRVGGDSLGKKAGTKVLCKLTSGGTLNECIALGSKSSDAWRVVDGSANYTPVNLSAWTASAGCTYAAGLLTADGVDDPTATQTVALKAGTYYMSARGTAEGALADHDAAKVVVTGATDGELVNKTFKSTFHPTAAETATAEREEYSTTFTLTADQNVVVTLSNVNEAGALEAGSSYIVVDPFEAYPA